MLLEQRRIFLKGALLFLVMSLLIVGCSNSNLNDNSGDGMDTLFPDVEMNTTLKLEMRDQPAGTFKIGERLMLFVKNTSQYTVEFSDSNSLKLYDISNISVPWTEMENGPRHIYESNTLPPSSGNGLVDSRIVIIAPEISNANEPITVRVVVLGYITDSNNSTKKEVGAYIDIGYEP